MDNEAAMREKKTRNILADFRREIGITEAWIRIEKEIVNPAIEQGGRAERAWIGYQLGLLRPGLTGEAAELLDKIANMLIYRADQCAGKIKERLTAPK